MGIKDGLRNANFRENTKSVGDSCFFCEYRVLKQDTSEISCKYHNVNFGKDFSSGEYVCDYFQESGWFGTALDLLSKS